MILSAILYAAFELPAQCQSLTFNKKSIVIYCTQVERAKDVMPCPTDVILKPDSEKILELQDLLRQHGLQGVIDSYEPNNLSVQCDLSGRKFYFKTGNRILVSPGSEGSSTIRSIVQLDNLYDSDDIEYEVGLDFTVELSTPEKGPFKTRIEIRLPFRKRDKRDAHPENWSDFESRRDLSKAKEMALSEFNSFSLALHQIFIPKL